MHRFGTREFLIERILAEFFSTVAIEHAHVGFFHSLEGLLALPCLVNGHPDGNFRNVCRQLVQSELHLLVIPFANARPVVAQVHHRTVCRSKCLGTDVGRFDHFIGVGIREGQRITPVARTVEGRLLRTVAGVNESKCVTV